MISIKKSLVAIVLGAGLMFPLFAVGKAKQLAVVQALAGRYSHHFQNGMMDGEKYESDDVVESCACSRTMRHTSGYHSNSRTPTRAIYGE